MLLAPKPMLDQISIYFSKNKHFFNVVFKMLCEIF